MLLKLNLKTQSIEEACCDELLGIKCEDIKIGIWDEGVNSCNRLGLITSYFTILLTTQSGVNIPLYFCPYCGESLEYKLGTSEFKNTIYWKYVL